jgi:hypothetical protein
MTTTSAAPDSSDKRTIAVQYVATTPEEAEKYEGYVERDFVRVDETGKPDAKFKKFFYRVEAIFPQYFGHGNRRDMVTVFNVQKYHVDQQITTTVNGKSVKRPSAARWIEWDGVDWQTVDSDAQFSIKCDDFDKKFKAR